MALMAGALKFKFRGFVSIIKDVCSACSNMGSVGKVQPVIHSGAHSSQKSPCQMPAGIHSDLPRISTSIMALIRVWGLKE